MNYLELSLDKALLAMFFVLSFFLMASPSTIYLVVNLYIRKLVLTPQVLTEELWMYWINCVLLVAFITGFIFFLYGANIYNSIFGYSGIYLSIGAIATYLIHYIYRELNKKVPD